MSINHIQNLNNIISKNYTFNDFIDSEEDNDDKENNNPSMFNSFALLNQTKSKVLSSQTYTFIHHKMNKYIIKHNSDNFKKPILKRSSTQYF